MTGPELVLLRAQLIRHEGMSLRLYKDTTGHWMIGAGRNLSDIGITVDEAGLMLDNDIARTLGAVENMWPWFDRLDSVRQRAFMDLAFNLGVDGLAGFPRFLENARTGHHEDAAAELEASKWFRQVGERGPFIVRQWRTGEA